MILFPILVLFLTGAGAQAQTRRIKILFTSALNGNLGQCDCAAGENAGLLRRFSFIEKYRRENRDSLLFETGDILGRNESPQTTAFLLQTYRRQGYDLVLPGEQDLSSELFRENDARLPLIGNSTAHGSVFSRTMDRGDFHIGIVGYISPDSFRYSGVSASAAGLTGSCAELGQESRRLKQRGAQFVIALVHSSLAEARAAAEFPDVDLVIGGHEDIRPSAAQKLHRGKYVLFAGREGEYAGEIVLVPGNGRWVVESERLIHIIAQNPPEDPVIREFIRNLKPR